MSSQGFAENNDYQTVADSLLYGGEGLMFEDPLMSCLGSFYKYSRQIGPHKANQEITFEKTYQTEGAGDFAIITGISENNNGIYSFDIQGFGINLIQNYFVPTFGQTDGYDIAAKIQNMKSFDSNYVPKNLYRFSKQYFEHGIQFFEFRDPATSNNNSYVDPYMNWGFNNNLLYILIFLFMILQELVLITLPLLRIFLLQQKHRPLIKAQSLILYPLLC